MYQVSSEAELKFAEDSRMFGARIRAGDKEITSGFVSIKQYCQSTSGNNISIGDAVSSNVQVQIWKPDDFTFDSEFELSIGIYLDDESIEYVPIGLYTPEKPTENVGIISFTAYDRLNTRMDGKYTSKLEYPVDGKFVIAEIAEMTGVPIDTSNLEDGVMIPKKQSGTEMTTDTNGNVVTAIKYENPYDGYSYKDALSYLAQFYCKFVTVNRSGTIEFRWYTDTDYTLDSSRYYEDISISEDKFNVKSITCVVGSKTLGSGNGISSIQMENPVMTQDKLNGVYDKVKGISYYPIKTQFFGDPRLDLGDIIKLIKIDGTELSFPLMYISQDYDGGFITEIASYGRTEQETASAKSPTNKRLEQLESDILVMNEIVAKKADFDEVFSKMITTSKIIFDNQNIIEFFDRMIEVNSSLQKTLDGLSLEVKSVANKKNISNNSEIQDYDVQEIPTLDNYPTITDFFIFDVCSEELICSEDLICGTNDYDAHLSNIAKNEANGKYYVFEKNTEGVYGWREMSEQEINALSDTYAAVNVNKGEVDIVARKESNECEVKISSDGMRATAFYCC